MWSPLFPVWTKPAAKALAKLPADVRLQIEAAVNRYAATVVGNVKALQGKSGVLRLRSGDYRSTFTILVTVHEMTILAVAHRREIYD